MSLRPAISAPLPWLTMLAGRLLKGGQDVNGKKRGKMKFPRSLSVTKEGKWYIGILLIIGVGAINTGNNLIYLVVATLLSLIIISGILSESTLRGVKVERRLPQIAFKGSPARATLRISNTKKRVPSYSFLAVEMDSSGTSAYVLKLGPGEAADIPVEYTFQRRGLTTLTGVRITTRFPFGLFTKGKKEFVRDEILVLPSVQDGALGPEEETNGAHGELSRSVKGSGGGLYGLREYSLADDARHIHWKSAARAQKLLLKEFESESMAKAVVVFENRGPSNELFEELVDRAAGTINAYIEKGFSVGLKTLSTEIAPASGRAHLMRLLSELALISPAAQEGSPSVKVVRL
ncbi:MAG: DUF58 domain-containing protein [Deltaproteobacteria bacterium]|nr:DUF58 domain-containing protein [Deltaproteobacteria bacterium]